MSVDSPSPTVAEALARSATLEAQGRLVEAVDLLDDVDRGVWDPEIEEFQIILTREDGIRDEITVQVELGKDKQGEWAAMQAPLGKDLADNHEGLRFNLELAEPGSLPRFELKAKRLQDRRNQ